MQLLTLDPFQSLLLRLLDHTSGHFAAEQTLMRASQFPGLDAHVAEHARLLEQLDQMLADHASGRQPLTPERVRQLGPWLTRHVDGADRKLVDYVKERWGGLGPE